ncbi:hypothetical protein BGZ98_002724, partial [Dissophora globulifera]
MMASNTTLPLSASKDSPAAETRAYPSPSLSPATSFRASMQQQSHSPAPSPSASNQRRSSVKALLSSHNPPASPLDALVMALEATVEEEEGTDEDAALSIKVENEDDDPDATIPSSPTMFMKRS